MEFAWAMSMLLVVLALNLQEAASYGHSNSNANIPSGSCQTPEGVILKNLEKAVSSNCVNTYHCLSGNIIALGHYCPAFTTCSNGVCKCKEGYVVKTRERSGLLRACQKKGTIGKGLCQSGDEMYYNGDKWLSIHCWKKLSCEKGIIIEEPYKLPQNTYCSYERIKCNKNCVPMDYDKYGLLTGCRELKPCKVGGTDVPSGAAWLSDDCKTKSICYDGLVKQTKELYVCPYKSRCDNKGRCVCVDWWKTMSRFTNGLLGSCQEETEKDDVCKYEETVYQDGDVWLSLDCKHKLTCKGGIIIYEEHELPKHSQCVYGREECEKYYTRRARDRNGFLMRCRAQNDCYVNHKYYQNGEIFLTNNCGKQTLCHDGHMYEMPYRCPFNSHCETSDNYSYCKCNDGWKQSAKTTQGLLWECKRETAKVNTCEYNSEYFEEGAKWLSVACHYKLHCYEGDIIAEAIPCPRNSECVRQQVKCKENFVPVEQDEYGVPLKCRAAKKCKIGNTLYKSDTTWLSDNCETSLHCYDGIVSRSPHECPRQSKCDNSGTCKCDEGWKRRGIHPNGLLCDCQRDSAPDDVCTYEGKEYQNGQVWLAWHCYQKFQCLGGIITYIPYKLPENAKCKNGQVNCGANFYPLNYQGLVSRCRAQRDCQVGNKLYKSGEDLISGDCKEKKRCRDGQFDGLGSYACPPDSHCIKGQCRCNDWYVPTARYSNGILVSCVKENLVRRDGKCQEGQTLYENGEAWYSNACFHKRYCDKSVIVITRFDKRPDHSKCVNGKLECKENSIEEVDDHGLVVKCHDIFGEGFPF